jgi:hypothetical protein
MFQPPTNINLVGIQYSYKLKRYLIKQIFGYS